MIFRPATPGFLVTLVATILLAIVSFSVPWFKSVYFLQAVVDVHGQNGTATFGVLGYCFSTGGNVNCTSPQLGYEFDPNALLDNTTPIKIPQVIVKWLTYALVLHIVALALAAGSAVFGLLAHIREMSMVCCSTCMSGFGAAVTLIAFIFDIAFFFLVKARINKVPGGSAQIGNAVWFTLAAWILLFLAGCFYGFGRCCINRRPRGPHDPKLDPPYPGNQLETGKADTMRLDAVKAEADRKARQKQGEIGLPAFQEYDPTRPLTAKEDEDESYSDHQSQPQPRRQLSAFSNNQTEFTSSSHPGYVPAVPGTSAMDAYHNAPAQSSVPQVPLAAASYPPQPPQTHAQYPSSQYNAYGGPEPNNGQYLSPTTYGAYGHNQYPSNVSRETSYGHPGQESTYYSAASHYEQPSHYAEPSYNAVGYANLGSSVAYPSSGAPASNGGGNSHQPPMGNFTASGAPGSMGRDDYSFSKTPPPADTYHLRDSSTPNPHEAVAPTSQRVSPAPRGPRSPVSPTTVSFYSQQSHLENPPGYDTGAGTSSTTWPNEKR